MHFDIYTSPSCSKCKLTASRLKSVELHGEPVHTVNLIDVTVVEGAHERALEISGGVKTLPIVAAADGSGWHDFRIDKLKHWGA